MAWGAPLLVIASSALATHYLSPYAEKTGAELAHVGKRLGEITAQITNPESQDAQVSILRPFEGASKIRARLEEGARKLADLTWGSMKLLLSYLAVVLSELLFLPLVLGLFVSSTLSRITKRRVKA